MQKKICDKNFQHTRDKKNFLNIINYKSFHDASQGQEKTLGSKDYVHYLDCRDSPTGVNSLKSCPTGLTELVTNRRNS